MLLEKGYILASCSGWRPLKEGMLIFDDAESLIDYAVENEIRSFSSHSNLVWEVVPGKKTKNISTQIKEEVSKRFEALKVDGLFNVND